MPESSHLDSRVLATTKGGVSLTFASVSGRMEVWKHLWADSPVRAVRRPELYRQTDVIRYPIRFGHGTARNTMLSL